MDAMNLVIGAVLFVVVMIVLLTNNQKVADLKKSIKTSAVEAPVAVSHGFLARNSAGDYVPKKPYYLELVPKPANAPDKHEDIKDQICVNADDATKLHGKEIFDDIIGGRCRCIYRPETRVIYKVKSIDYYNGATWVNFVVGATSSLPAINNSQPYILNLERNVDTSSTTPMFATSDIEKTDKTPRMRTIIGVPAEMSGNTVSGV